MKHTKGMTYRISRFCSLAGEHGPTLTEAELIQMVKDGRGPVMIRPMSQLFIHSRETPEEWLRRIGSNA